jgi:hypothetical protein
MSRKKKFHRRIRERMTKTGESYSIARMNLSKVKADAQPASASPAPAPEPPPRFAIHRLLAERSQLRSSDTGAKPKPERQSLYEKRLWARL